jgi:hypothetical protein
MTINLDAQYCRKNPVKNSFVMFAILFVDIALLVFATYSLFNALKKYNVLIEKSKTVLLASSQAVPADSAQAIEEEKAVGPVLQQLRKSIETQAADTSASVSRQNQLKPQLLTSAVSEKPADSDMLVLDDFNNGAANNISGLRKVESGYGGTLTETLSGPEGRHLLVLNYNVSASGSFSRHKNLLKDIDLSRYTSLVFDIMGEKGDEVFSVGLTNGKFSRVIGYSQLFPQAIPRNWKTVTIPLEWFADTGKNYLKEGSFNLIFSNDLGMPYKGTLYIKNIKLANSSK